MTRIYKPLELLSKEEINEILNNWESEELARLPFSLGEYALNWKYAQHICVRLAKHEDARVRANAVLGLAYIARTKGKLEKHIVKPIVLKELNENEEYEWRIIDAIEDINIFMKWNIGKKALDRRR